MLSFSPSLSIFSQILYVFFFSFSPLLPLCLLFFSVSLYLLLLLLLTMRRLGEPHRLLNSRKGEPSTLPTGKTQTRMTRPRTSIRNLTQAFDALAKEYVDFEATMANVTSEQEAGDVLHAATLEVAEELERAQKDQGRVQDDLHCSSDALTAEQRIFRLLGCTRGHGR